MLIKTHLAISLFFVLLFIQSFESKIVFVLVALIATYIPDIDSRFSKLGRKKVFRILQWFAGHRKVFHSFLFLGLVFIGLYFVSEVVAFGFLIGYGSHLFADALTVQGICLFYPLNFKVRGFIRTGGFLEYVILICFILIDLWLIFLRFFN